MPIMLISSDKADNFTEYKIEKRKLRNDNYVKGVNILKDLNPKGF